MPKEKTLTEMIMKKYDVYGKDYSEMGEALKTLPDSELEIMKDAYPSNIHINKEIKRREKK